MLLHFYNTRDSSCKSEKDWGFLKIPNKGGWASRYIRSAKLCITIDEVGIFGNLCSRNFQLESLVVATTLKLVSTK